MSGTSLAKKEMVTPFRLVVVWIMRNLIGTGLLCLLSLSPRLLADEAYPAYFKLAQPPGTVGETGPLYLIDEGLYARPLYNDIFGGTDKYLSGELQVGWMFVGEEQSLSLDYSWRFLTPDDSPGSDGKVPSVLPGRYADWMEIQASYASVFGRVLGRPLRFQYTLGLSHIGDHGGRSLHRSIHEATGSSLEGLEYSNQPQGSDISRGLEVAVLGAEDLIYSLGGFANKFMNEGYLKINHVWRRAEGWQWGSEVKLVRQFQSVAYSDPRDWRYEISTGMRWGWYRPSIKFVSPFLKSDSVSQVYLDPLAVFFEFK